MRGLFRTHEAILWILTVTVSLILLGGVWYIASSLVNRPYLPSPSAVLVELWLLMKSGELGFHIVATLVRVFAALSLAAALATISGIVAVRTSLGKPLRILVTLLIPVPMMALLPLFIKVFGFEVIKVVLIIATLYPILTVGVSEAVSRVPREYEELLISMGAGFMHVLKFVILPSIFMPLMTSLRICIGVALSLTFVVESAIMSSRDFGSYGLGVLIETAYRIYDYTTVYAGLVTLSALGFTMYGILWLVEVQYRRTRKL
ncbi:MAG: ABC transporter permease subunit [Acidilobaceae archaeon]